MADREKIRTYREFWPVYLSEHSNPVNRWFHFTGTTIALALIVAAIATGNWGLLIVALISGYAFAWCGHFFVEKNRPTTFQYPLWSFISDWRMWLLTLFRRSL